jgi:hypothetical protein
MISRRSLGSLTTRTTQWRKADLGSPWETISVSSPNERTVPLSPMTSAISLAVIMSPSRTLVSLDTNYTIIWNNIQSPAIRHIRRLS